MVLLGRLHPLLIHFPIALAIIAAAAEAVAMITNDRRWQAVAVANIRAAAAFGLMAAIAGARLALSPGIEASALLDWHRRLGIAGVVAMLAAAFAASRTDSGAPLHIWTYRVALASAALLVAVTGHFGGLLVWGPDFLHP